jgi:hypothetical protein
MLYMQVQQSYDDIPYDGRFCAESAAEKRVVFRDGTGEKSRQV